MERNLPPRMCGVCVGVCMNMSACIEPPSSTLSEYQLVSVSVLVCSVYDVCGYVHSVRVSNVFFHPSPLFLSPLPISRFCTTASSKAATFGEASSAVTVCAGSLRTSKVSDRGVTYSVRSQR